MTERRVFMLAALALIVIAGALWLASQRHLPRDVDVGNKLFPELKTGEIREINVTKAGAKRVVTLENTGTEWTVAERDRYPADAARVRGLVLGIAGLTIVEEKTSDPKNHAAIGVEDIAGPAAAGTQIELKGANGSTRLIVGRSSGAKASFVRRPGNAKSLLATPQVYADPDPKNWLRRSIVDIAADRVQEVRITLGKINHVLTRKDRAQSNFTLASVPTGKVLASETAGNVAGTALAGLELDDVKKLDATEWQTPVDHAEIRTFDGWVISVDGRTDGDKHWIRLASRYDEALAKAFPAPPPDPKAPADRQSHADVPKDAQALQARVAPWAFEVPKYKYDAFFKPLVEIIKKP
jgi:hypothetical protein